MSYDEYDKNHVSIGPWGGQQGARWDDGVHCSVRQVMIAHGARINSIQIEYDKRGCSFRADKHGGNGGLRVDTVKLDYPNEFLVSMSGHYGRIDDGDPTCVVSLIFESNRKIYGPFGIQQGTPFSLSTIGGKIVGFHGRSSWYLDSIGIYLRPLLQRNLSNNFNGITEKKKKLSLIEKEDKPMTRTADTRRFTEGETKEKMIAPNGIERGNSDGGIVTHGPWGGTGGILFNDGIHSGVREIHLTRYGGVTSIRVCYDQMGQAIWGIKNGSSGGIRTDKIVFDYPNETLTNISGHYGPVMLMGPTVIKSLAFHTNKKSYGPFGEERGTSFSSGLRNSIIVGFHGRNGWFIDGIGVHVIEQKPLAPSDVRLREVVQTVAKDPILYGPRSRDGYRGTTQTEGVDLQHWPDDEAQPSGRGPVTMIRRTIIFQM